MNFEPFPKMGRLYRDIIITEKLDGTNAQVLIKQIALENEEEDGRVRAVMHEGNLYAIFAGSRTRWLDTTSAGDNFGFAKWVSDNANELVKLGEGRHFGEWWGKGIQRGYGLEGRKFSLFNTSRWYDDMNHTRLAPACCDVVPVLYMGPFDEAAIKAQLERLSTNGSAAAAGFDKPEGIIIYHTHSNVGFKYTLGGDGHKGS